MQDNIIQLKAAIEQTLLKPEAKSADIIKLAQEAIANNFFGICVNSSYVALAKKTLANSSCKLVCVVGFPLGAMDSESKAFETRKAIEHGADEIDMVIHVGALKERNIDLVKSDIAAVVQAATTKPVKVIIETSLLTDEEKVIACECSVEAGAQFVKTCTGFSGGGATVADIKLMKKVVGSKCRIKASGGIKTAEQALDLLHAGANRLGTSSGVALISQKQISEGSY